MSHGRQLQVCFVCPSSNIIQLNISRSIHTSHPSGLTTPRDYHFVVLHLLLVCLTSPITHTTSSSKVWLASSIKTTPSLFSGILLTFSHLISTPTFTQISRLLSTTPDLPTCSRLHPHLIRSSSIRSTSHRNGSELICQSVSFADLTPNFHGCLIYRSVALLQRF